MARDKILIIDDDPAVLGVLKKYLELQSFEVEGAGSIGDGERLFTSWRPDVVILDYSLPDGNSLDLLPRLKAANPGVPVILLTGHGTIDLAVRAIQVGADQFLTKPVELSALKILIDRLLENQRNRQKALIGKSQRERYARDPFVGSSRVLGELAAEARRVAASDSTVLIQGETGTGKGVLARWIHDHSARAEEAFVDLNCAGLSRDFLETELFGHEKGAFTGAVASKLGLLEVGHRGTVFLDEIGDVDLQVQPKLLKVLEEKRFHRLGDVRDRKVDIRLVAATHQDLRSQVKENRFRSDLYFRISTIPLVVPPLRDRPEDIPAIAAVLLENLAADLGRAPAELTPEAGEALLSYSWPGNIRELRNVLERALLVVSSDRIERRDLKFEIDSARASRTLDSSLTLLELERQYIAQILREEGGHVERAARRLGIPRSSLYSKIKQFGLATPES